MHRLLLASCLAIGLVQVAQAAPNHASQEAPLAKDADKIKLYCGNPQLAIVVDWPAFENLDYQLLIAGEEGGDPSVPNRASDPSYVAAAKEYILTGNKQRGGLPGGPLGGRGGLIAESFQYLCRDHADMRGPASKITKIVLEPINDLKFQSDKDAIAFARRTNDWSGVHNSRYESMKNDAESHRAYYLRWTLKGSTLTVTFNILGFSGVADDYVKILQSVLGSGGGASDAAPAPTEKPARAPAPPPPPPAAEKPADTSAQAPGCRPNDRKCQKIEADKAKKWGPAINCDKGKYSGLSEFASSNDYTTGALVYQTWSAEPTQVYRCSNGSGCHGDDGPGGSSWAQVGHCSSQ